MARGGARPGSGPKKGFQPKWMPKKKVAVSGDTGDQVPVERENLTPLEFMLRDMNDTSLPRDYRARMAQAAAPFVHARADTKGGKKEAKDEAAKKAAGRFAPGAGPKIIPIQKHG